MIKLKDILIEAPGVKIKPKTTEPPETAEDIKKRLNKNIKLAIDQTNVYLKLLQQIKSEADMAGFITGDVPIKTLTAGVKIKPKEEEDPNQKYYLDYKTDRSLIDLSNKHNAVNVDMKKLRSKIGDTSLFKL